jgi:hypothetical protein
MQQQSTDASQLGGGRLSGLVRSLECLVQRLHEGLQEARLAREALLLYTQVRCSALLCYLLLLVGCPSLVLLCDESFGCVQLYCMYNF